MPSKHATSTDGKWCLEQLFNHMELNLRNRVQAKTGRGNVLDVVKLSNLMHTALAHPSKPRTPVSPNRVRRLETAVSISPDQRTALREVYIHYCSWAEKHNYLYMSMSQFLRCCRDTYIMGGDLDGTALSLLFEKVHKDSPDQAPGGRFSQADWLLALITIANRMYPFLTPQQSWEKLISDHILPFAGRSTSASDRLSPVMLQADVVQAVADAKHKLKPVFDFYVGEQDVSEARPRSLLHQGSWNGNSSSAQASSGAPSPTPSLLPPVLRQTEGAGGSCRVASLNGMQGGSHPGSDPLTWPALDRPPSSPPPPPLGSAREGSLLQLPSPPPPPLPAATSGGGQASAGLTAAQGASRLLELQTAKSQMPMPVFMRFLHDFNVMPELISKAAAAQCFRAARFGPGSDDSEGADLQRVDFDEFMDAIGRVALIAYHYEVKVEPPKLMVFQEGYHTGAKHLWTAAHREEYDAELMYPDEVELPAALCEEGLGGEDSPHWDTLDHHSDGGGSDGGRSRRSTRSRAGAIFRSARSLAQYRTKVSVHRGDGGGMGGQHEGSVEVMAIHGEQDVLPDDSRPRHLRDFNPDWVGKPGLALNETARLQSRTPKVVGLQPVYGGSQMDAGLPPVFKERGEAMVAARVVREQAVEALRLQYVARRREAQRAALADATVSRQQLQSVARQPLTQRQIYARTLHSHPLDSMPLLSQPNSSR